VDGSRRALGLLREIREEVLHLQRLAHGVLHAAVSGDEAARSAAATALEALGTGNAAEVDERFAELRRVVREDPGLRKDLGEVETRLQNAWDVARLHLDAIDPARAESYQAFADAVEDIVLEVAYTTVPPRMTENLRSIRIGAALDFAGEVEDELPSEAHQRKVFDWMYRHGAHVPGLFDRRRMVIYKAAERPEVRALTIAAIATVVVVLAALPMLRDVLGLSSVLVANASERSLSTAFLWALAGLGAHAFLGQLKELRRAVNDGEPDATMGNWVLWLHVRYVSIILTLALLFVVTMMVAATGSRDAITMLAVGYSLDSIADLALPKVTSLLAKRTEVIGKALGAPATT
jgi:hypothetical protein